MKRTLIVMGLLALLGLGGFFVVTQAQDVPSNETTWSFPWMGNSNSFGCRGGMNAWADESTNSNEYFVIFPWMDGVDSLIGETFHVQLINTNDEIVYEDDVTTMPSGGIWIWVEDGFEGQVIVTYGDFSGSESLVPPTSDFDCLANKISIELR